MYCPSCGLKQPEEHRYCVSCGVHLPSELLHRGGPKESQWFLGVHVVADDPPSAALRATRYLEEFEAKTAEGSALVPSHHVRFSVWHGDEAVAAVSLPDDEATRLAEFLLAAVREPSKSG